MKEIGAGCQTPVGALSGFSGQLFFMKALVAEPDGTKVLYEMEKMESPDPKKVAELGRRLAIKLLEKGGAEIVKRVEREKHNEW
jgi:porphobilinogen deaminase